MNFFYIQHDSELKATGFYPQTSRAKNKGYHVDAHNSERKLVRDKFPDFSPKYGLDIHPESIATDVLYKSTLPFGFVVSAKMKLVLEKFKLPPHRFYPIDVFGSDGTYYWFHAITDTSEFIDFENTEIEIFNVTKQVVLETVQLPSLEDIKTLKRKFVLMRGVKLRYKSITLKNKPPKYDLFQIDGAQYFTLINEDIKIELEKENITGLEIQRYDKLRLNKVE